MAAKKSAKLLQLVGLGEVLYALDADGRLWRMTHLDKGWDEVDVNLRHTLEEQSGFETTSTGSRLSVKSKRR
jgi:hypothetical protein